MTDQVVLTEKQGGVLILTLNRPDAMNAFNYALVNGLQEQIDAVRFNPEVRVVIITGSGEKAFGVGADLKERATLTDLQVRDFISRLHHLFSSVEHSTKPVIAAINGFALGGGLELALACDIRIASADASMGQPETRLAIIPGGGGTQRLPRLIGRAKAKELIFTGRRADAEEALRLGLVNSVCAKPDLMNECMKMAGMMCEAGPIAIEQAKYAINFGLETDLQTGLAIERNAYWITIPTKDRVEALTAFREKRKPVFKGE